MSAQTIVRDWRRYVKAVLLPQVHGHQANALADLSLAMVHANHCHSGKVAVSLPTDAQPASVRRRLERTLANDRIAPRPVLGQLASGLLTAWSARPLRLTLDETPNANHWRCLKLCVIYRQRAIPLLSVCYPPDRPPQPMPALVASLLRQAAECVPAGATVTLLVDRGLAWPQTLDVCRDLGWHWLFRLQCTTKLRPDDGSRERTVGELLTEPGQSWFGQGQIFKKAGWRQSNVVAVWDQGQKEPWLLATSWPANRRSCQGYAKRLWQEQTHRDEKSHGFYWGQSHVRQEAHGQRLLLLMALAMVLALGLGTAVLKRGWRKQLEGRRQRKLSVFTLGMRWLKHILLQERPPPLRIYICPYP